jgi:hypothetical protein
MALVSTLASCDSSSTQEPKGARRLVVVTGIVRTSAGATVPVAAIRVSPIFTDGSAQIRVGSCSGLSGQAIDVRSNAVGRYVARVEGYGPISEFCLGVQAVDPSTGRVNGTASRDSVAWTAGSADTVRIDVSLDAS